MVNTPSDELFRLYFRKEKKFHDYEVKTNLEFNLANIKESIHPEKYQWSKNVVIIGEVQSGKTNNLIEIVDFVIKKKIYDHIIWLSGTNKILAYQTLSRYTNQTNSDFYSASVHFYHSTLLKDSPQLTRYLSKDGVTISLVMKEFGHLNKVKDCFKQAKTYGKKILIVDDECDFFSIEKNSNREGGKIAEIIQSIKDENEYEKSLYLGVTATPYSSLNKKLNNRLYPDELILLNTNYKEYTGLEWFNSNAKELYITSTDAKNQILHRNSLELALISFINAYSIRSKEGKISEMLININLENEKQEKIRNQLSSIFDNWRSEYNLKPTKFKETILKHAEEMYLKNFNFDFFCETIGNYENLFEIICLNSRNKAKNESSMFQSGKSNAIIIGGFMVSRGYTFECLVTQVMLNIPEEKISIDVLLQRARWFGYRRSMKDYLRIILNKKIIRALVEAEEVATCMKNFFGKNWVTNQVEKLYYKIKSISNGMKSLEVK